MRTAIYILAFIALSVGAAFAIRFTGIEKTPSSQKEKQAPVSRKGEKGQTAASIEIVKKYTVPPLLREISALVYLDKHRFACVQDELGSIFIYNSRDEKIEKEIPFSEAGDFEGLAVAGTAAYALRSDGMIFEIKDYLGKAPAIRSFQTPLTAEQNTEGLCYDPAHQRLLVAIKGPEQQNKHYKGIYSFSLSNYQMSPKPVFKIDLNHPVFAEFKTKKQGAQMQPSAIAIHPQTGDLYITEGAKPKLLVLDNEGKVKWLKTLNHKDFYKPEGISFSPEGNLYISSEGKKEPGMIAEVEIL